ncbi:PepSY domain-containing protein [Microvirga guangxiensis]|uniref:Peptidase propeptide and YPEB domain-containing protein n=1 Tax=Microvirga guangxiensis TaxID=549386 RepID=A0A1G5L329_9HYPH|nr:PepSY domain-containing protein [Microvirga guangxiensis]SCZ06589.1 Peptidase propeptide and YPEB domain-containing protein [Microvirga guangxiensis]
MRTIIMTSTLLMAGLAVPALADGSYRRCTPRDDGRIVAASEVSKELEAFGYRVDRLKAEHGCYEVRAVNDSGFPIKAVYTQATGELVQARLR